MSHKKPNFYELQIVYGSNKFDIQVEMHKKFDFILRNIICDAKAAKVPFASNCDDMHADVHTSTL